MQEEVSPLCSGSTCCRSPPLSHSVGPCARVKGAGPPCSPPRCRADRVAVRKRLIPARLWERQLPPIFLKIWNCFGFTRQQKDSTCKSESSSFPVSSHVNKITARYRGETQLLFASLPSSPPVASPSSSLCLIDDTECIWALSKQEDSCRKYAYVWPLKPLTILTVLLEENPNGFTPFLLNVCNL